MLFRFAAKVEYRKEYPRWAPSDIIDNRRVMELILTKSSDWSYEEEYRLVNIAAPPSSSFLQLHGDFFRLPSGALKSVIMGCEAHHKTIAALIKEVAPDIPIKRAKRIPNLYKLEIVDYLPGWSGRRSVFLTISISCSFPSSSRTNSFRFSNAYFTGPLTVTFAAFDHRQRNRS